MEKFESIPFLDGFSSSKEAHQRRRPWGVLAVYAFGAITICTIFYQLGAHFSSSTTPSTSAASPSDISSTNATLGFGEVLLLNLPERTDRRDAVSLIGSLSGITITKVFAAVKGEDVSEKAKPIGNDKIDQSHLGSWRTHVDAFRYVVDNNIETALILEDDVDWDVRIKPQMAAFAAEMRSMSIRNHSLREGPEYPYGTDWDILHLGASRIRGPNAPFDKVFSLYADPDRPKNPGCPNHFWKWFCWNEKLKELNVPAGHRAILPSNDTVGLSAIAVTYSTLR